VAAVVAGALVAGGCSSDEPDRADRSAAATTSSPSVVPLTTTTEVEGDPVSDQEVYTQVGLSPEQSACIEAAGVNGDFQVDTGATPTDAIVLTAEDSTMVAVPSTLRTGTELEQLILSTLAADCAPADLLSKLAALDGEAGDAAALTDDLPARLAARRADGATETELSCLDAAFRAAPARLSSLAASPGLIESMCAPAERRDAWRRAALDRGLATAGATVDERACVVADVHEQLLLAAAIDAVGSGDVSANPFRDEVPACGTTDRLNEIALGVVSAGADFGAEDVAPAATLPAPADK